jgi:glycosyltransferase involved in cell wall biosynthesis
MEEHLAAMGGTAATATNDEPISRHKAAASNGLRIAGQRVDEYDVLCFSHLRWDFVYQRPQHLLSRCAQSRRVFYVEEPSVGVGSPCLEITRRSDTLSIVVPMLPDGLAGAQAEAVQRRLLDGLLRDHAIRRYAAWYYTPMALGFTGGLRPLVTVYDCMDELSAFAFAPPELREREAELLRRADLVFTGGASLFEAKRGRHPAVHAFPSSVDVAHFGRARGRLDDPADQGAIGRPRLGFFGVIDERMDLDLIRGIATRRPDWQLVLLGPVAKIDEAALPRLANIHYLGPKGYDELPAYLAHWDVALLPFALNASTRFISPTKTPEYLAAGKPVVSTPIRDVVRPYGEGGLVRIAGDAEAFVRAVEAALAEAHGPSGARAAWLARVDERLSRMSWDGTWAAMEALIRGAVAARGGALHAGV